MPSRPSRRIPSSPMWPRPVTGVFTGKALTSHWLQASSSFPRRARSGTPRMVSPRGGLAPQPLGVCAGPDAQGPSSLAAVGEPCAHPNSQFCTLASQCPSLTLTGSLQRACPLRASSSEGVSLLVRLPGSWAGTRVCHSRGTCHYKGSRSMTWLECVRGTELPFTNDRVMSNVGHRT